mgnify:CR=1 FL=1
MTTARRMCCGFRAPTASANKSSDGAREYPNVASLTSPASILHCFCRAAVANNAAITAVLLISADETIFYGDAMNDESMFKDFQNSVGVSNIISVLDKLTHKPSIVLEGKENAGPNGVLHHLKEVFDQSADF